MPSPIQHALSQVQVLQRTVIDSQRFHGWSGPARGSSGAIALIMAMALSLPQVGAEPWRHVVGWGVVFAAALCITLGAMARWFWLDPAVNRDWRRLRPVAAMLPSILVGGLLTGALLRVGQFDLLFGMWMVVFGLTNLASRRVLPRSMAYVAAWYIGAGAVLLCLPGLSFTNPWPMGLVFFLGELAGGVILYTDRSRRQPGGPTPSQAGGVR